MDKEDLEDFVNDEDTALECLQIAPMGNGRVAILFMLSDSDYVTTVSVIFIVDDFDAKTAKGVLVTSEWLMALSASPTGELFALEATAWIWRYAGVEWTRDKITTKNLRTVWAEDAAGPIAVGEDGFAYRLTKGTWQLIPPIDTATYTDVKGDPKHGVYACGQRGIVHRLSASGWQPVELHRHDDLNSIDVSADGTIRVAGDDGICLRIANDELIELEADAEMTYLAVKSFAGKAYWGDEVGVNTEDGDAIVPFEDTEIASDLRSDGDYLYAAGTDSAWRFDGKKWKSLALSYDDGFRLIAGE